MSTSSHQFEGRYFDGQTPQPRKTRITLYESKIELAFDKGKTRAWSYSNLQLLTARGHGESVQVAYKDPESNNLSEEILEVSEPGFIEAMEAASQIAFRTPVEQLVPRKMKWMLYVGSGASVVLVFLIIWGGVLPLMSGFIADNIPVSWEEKLGKSFVPQFIGNNPPPTPPKARHAMDEISKRLLQTIPDQPYTFRIYVVESRAVNALALPGGYIVVFQGLINMTQTPEELAGILAHEFQHVLKHHATRGIFRQYALAATLNLLAGGSDFMEMVLGTAGTLESLRHSRELESEADREGMNMVLAAGIDPKGMVSAYKKLREEELKGIEELKDAVDLEEYSGNTDWLDYLSTHPDTGNRIKELINMAESGTGNYQPLLPDLDWKSLHKKIEKQKRKSK